MADSPQTPLDLVLTSERLPSPSGVALQILQLTRDPDASLDDLTNVLTLDPALAGQILKYAGSASVSGGSECRTINDAVLRLGMAAVRRLSLTFSLLASARSGPCPAFDYNRFWSQSLATAVAAQVLAPHTTASSGDEAFTCGLLGQIGQLCLASVHPYKYAEVIASGLSDDLRPLAEREIEVLSVSSFQITAELFTSWGLPPEFGEAIVAQTRPQSPGQVDLAAILRTAHCLAEVCVADPDTRAGCVAGVLALGREIGLDGPTLTAACDEAVAEWTRMGDALSIITEDVPALEELMDRAGQLARQQDPKTGAAEATARVVAGTAPEVESLRILVVDDSPLDQRIVASVVEKADHRVKTAGDGEEALRVVTQWSPHLIISDWMMPNLNGLELCQALRSSEQTSRVYIIMMTANDQSEDLVTALENGADDYLPKPVNHAVLSARLRAAERVIRLQEHVENDREQIRRIAADLSVANRKLQRMALYDGLTGLPNRRYAMDRLAKEWERAARQGEPLLCMMVDIDHFKQVNDTYGHDAGDVVLRQISQAMKDCLRASDDICRFGGEEFLAICPDADLEVAHTLGDRLREAVANLHIDTPEFQGSVTVSIGAANYAKELDTPAQLLKLADEALYAAKDAGRNKVCIVDPASVGS